MLHTVAAAGMLFAAATAPIGAANALLATLLCLDHISQSKADNGTKYNNDHQIFHSNSFG